MPETPTPLDLDAIEAAIAACRTYNFGMYQADRLAHEHAPALVAEVKRLRAEVDRLDDAWEEDSARCCTGDSSQHDGHHKSCRYVHGDLRPDPDDRPAPAWDEVPDVAPGTREMPAWPDATESLPEPVKPSREDIYRAWHGTDDPWAGCADSASIERVLALWPGESRAQVQAERDEARAEAARLLAERDEARAASARVHEAAARVVADEAAESDLTITRQRDRLRARERQVRRLRAEVTRLHALVADLRATASPAWDEEAAVEGMARAVYPSLFTDDRQPPRGQAHSDAELREGERDVARQRMRQALAVVREHLPVKPGREDVAEAMLGSDIITDDLRAEASAQGSTQREPFLCFADAILDLWPGRSEAEVKAEAVREVAKAYRKYEDEAYLFLAGSWLRVPWSAVARDLDDRAASLAAEGGVGRG